LYTEERLSFVGFSFFVMQPNQKRKTRINEKPLREAIDLRKLPHYSLRPMARRCVKTGQKTAFGNTRSHSMRHTRRTFKVNLQKKRVFDMATGTYKTMRVSTRYLRTLAKRLQEGKMA